VAVRIKRLNHFCGSDSVRLKPFRFTALRSAKLFCQQFDSGKFRSDKQRENTQRKHASAEGISTSVNVSNAV
jgi:hypothetical protein